MNCVILVFCAATLSGAIWVLWLLWRVLGIACGVTSKACCTGVFVSNRTIEAIIRQDLTGIIPLPLQLLRTKVDRNQGTVTTEIRVLGFAIISRTAVFSLEGCRLGGAILLPRGSAIPSLQKRSILSSNGSSPISLPLPQAPKIPLLTPPHVNSAQIMSAVISAMNNQEKYLDIWGTRAIVVAQGGRIIVESYREEFTKDTPLPVWSVAKSLLNAMIGARIKQGKMRIDDIINLPGGRASTVSDLMRMQDVLLAEDNSYPLGAAQLMLFESGDTNASALTHGNSIKISTVDNSNASSSSSSSSSNGWRYSSCVANVLSRYLRSTFENDDEYKKFAQEAVFDPAGMTSATLEFDSVGTAVASSFAVGTARDWARFGMLYLGKFGAQVLPSGWMDFTSRPANGSCGGYGALFWLGGPTAGALEGGLHDTFWSNWPWRSAPSGTILASGLEGQAVVVVPAYDLVVVRLGRSPVKPVGAWHRSNARLVCSVVEALSLH